jgi:hypothetical protein
MQSTKTDSEQNDPHRYQGAYCRKLIACAKGRSKASRDNWSSPHLPWATVVTALTLSTSDVKVVTMLHHNEPDAHQRSQGTFHGASCACLEGLGQRQLHSEFGTTVDVSRHVGVISIT